MVKLTGFEGYQVGSYSKGMQQRLGLACALLPEPEVVFLDEPTSALDPIGRREVRSILVELRNRGVTVFLNSHLLSEVEMVCDRVAFMRNARVVAVGPLSQFLHAEVEVEVAVEQRTPAVTAILEQFGEPRWEDGTACVRLSRADAIPDLAEALVKAGARIHRIAPRTRSLEDVFVGIMEAETP
jgi:ABC-2 type transport system ATP-binding protein